MYAKVYKSLFDGTLRGKSDEILVFVNLLANSDREGFVDRHFQAISDETGLPIDRVKKAIEALEAKDTESRSQELDGKRLERIDIHRSWGWRIVNYVKYRQLQDEEDRREYNRIKQAEHRAGKSIITAPTTVSIPDNLRGETFEAAWKKWVEHRKSYRKPKDWTMMFSEQLAWLSKFGPAASVEIIEQSIRNGWQGLFEPKSKHETNQQGRRQSVSRSAGTLNEGVSKDYAKCGKVPK